MGRSQRIQSSAIANLVGNALVHAYGAKNIVARLDAIGAVSICDDGLSTLPDQGEFQLARSEVGTSKQSGMGLGLSIVREIMIAHDATLTIIPNPGAGTTARLEFRLAEPATKL